jgi:hypothetical protein
MVSGTRFLLLVGSPRKRGTSCSFARTFGTLAAAAGCTAAVEHVYDYYDGRRPLAALQERIAESDIIGIIAPLYYDSLPGAVVWLLEQLSGDTAAVAALRGKGLFAIGQCAYPFAALNEPLIATCRCFAGALAMRWQGGLGYGGGVMIDGAPLEALGAKGEKIRSALQLALADLLLGQEISAKSQALLTMRFPVAVKWLLAGLMNLKIWWTARRMGVPHLSRKVYLQ